MKEHFKEYYGAYLAMLFVFSLIALKFAEQYYHPCIRGHYEYQPVDGTYYKKVYQCDCRIDRK